MLVTIVSHQALASMSYFFSNVQCSYSAFIEFTIEAISLLSPHLLTSWNKWWSY